jgi:hypothetical protein
MTRGFFLKDENFRPRHPVDLKKSKFQICPGIMIAKRRVNKSVRQNSSHIRTCEGQDFQIRFPRTHF